MSLSLLLLNFFALATPTWAHQLRTDGNIGAILHTDPEDNPYLGQPATLFFDFKAKSGDFNLENCQCQVKIVANQSELLNQPLVSSDQNSASVSFTFQNKGVYQIQVTGFPKSSSSWQAFTLNYDLRVERELGEKANNILGLSKNNFYLTAGSLVALMIIVIFVLNQAKRKAKNEK